MDIKEVILEKLQSYGVGRRKLDDDLFTGDQPLPRLGIYEADDETLRHEIIKSTCHIPGCGFTTDSLLEFESHYNASHRYSCSQCKKVLPSPHLLDLHIQEIHDSFFAVMAAKKPSYCCYVEECKTKFMNVNERLEHCVTTHKLPKDFRFDQKPKPVKKKKSKNIKGETSEASMELDTSHINNFMFSNSKQKTFSKYTGRKFTKENEQGNTTDVNMDNIMEDLKDSLP